MVWCCFGRRKWSERVWSPDGAAYVAEPEITELSPTFSTTSLIHDESTPTPIATGTQPVIVTRSATFPSLLPQSQRQPPHWVHQTNFTPQAAIVPDHSHFRRRSSDLPVTSQTPINSALRPPRPYPQSVPGLRQEEMAQSNFRTPYVVGATASPSRFRSSANLPRTSSRELQSGAQSANNLHEAAGAAVSPPRFRSSGNLPQSTSRQLRSATKSMNNLHEVAARNSSLYDRISSRLNEVIDQIDHEVFHGGEDGYHDGKGSSQNMQLDLTFCRSE
jgi:hypothetical protein